MSEQNLLNSIAGFREAWQAKEALERSGTDFHEIKGEVASTVVQLHPKRLELEVAEVIDETASTRTLRLVATDHSLLPPSRPGSTSTCSSRSMGWRPLGPTPFRPRHRSGCTTT